jgi:diguanylate cyclase (GGDEF)-like protein
MAMCIGIFGYFQVNYNISIAKNIRFENLETNLYPVGDYILITLLSSSIALAWYSRRNYMEMKKVVEEKNSMIVELKTLNTYTKHTLEKLEKISYTDGLTGLYNSRKFYEDLDDEIERSKRYNHKLSLVLIDVDNFKTYNDRCGHQEGDEALVYLAKIIRKNLRQSDKSYRYGGDEFLILLPETDKDKALEVAKRIKKSFDSFTFGKYRRSKDDPTLSMGISEYNKFQDKKKFVEEADRKMYEMKNRSKR